MPSTTSVSAAGVDATDPSGAELGKRQRNKLDKQRRIVEAATRLFQDKGFDATTTAEIAAKAGIGAGTLYLYVGSKEDLLVSVFEAVAGDAWSRALEHLDRTTPLLVQVMDLFTQVSDHHEADQRLARSFFKELPWLESSAREDAYDFVGAFQRHIEDLLDEAGANGRLDPDVPRPVLAANLYALWIHQMRRRASGRLDYDQMVAQLTASVSLALWGMTPETT